MAIRRQDIDYVQPVRRILIGVTVVILLLLFALWRIDNPRVERLRAAVVEAVVPNLSWALTPITAIVRGVQGIGDYAAVYEQNQELRREIQQLRAWREAALQLEEQYTRLLEVNRVKLDPELGFVSARVMADSGSPFRQSVLVNVGRVDGIVEGWAAMDGLGVAGRISGVGATTSRVLLLTDTSSRVPIVVQPSGQRGILVGDNSPFPVIELLESPQLVSAGDRATTAGDGGIFPPGLMVGRAAIDAAGRVRIAPAADYERLDFLRVIRGVPVETIQEPETLILPPPPAPAQAEGVSGNG